MSSAAVALGASLSTLGNGALGGSSKDCGIGVFLGSRQDFNNGTTTGGDVAMSSAQDQHRS